MISRKLLAVLALILTAAVWSIPVSAQPRGIKASPEQIEKLREKAFKLLASLADQVSSLQSAENRARIGSNIAGSLWKHDEQRARDVLALVEQDIKTGLQPAEPYDKSTIHTLNVFLRLRTDTVQRIAKHSSKAALAFFYATKPSFDGELRQPIVSAERALERELAKQVASESPELAAELSRKFLEEDLSSDVLSILRDLRRKNKEQARALHKEIADKLRSIEPQKRRQTIVLASELVYSFMPPEADDATFRELVNNLITIAMEFGCGKAGPPDGGATAFCIEIGRVSSVMEKVDPVRGARLRRWEFDPSESIASRQSQFDLYDYERVGSVDGMVALASKHPEVAQMLYERAAYTAMFRNGDSEQARKIVTELITDPEKKRSMLENFNSMDQPIDDVKLADIQKEIAARGNPEERATEWLIVLSHLMETNADRKLILKLASQAEEAVAAMKPDKTQFHYQTSIAIAYCLMKHERGFTIMESLIPKLNELVDAAVKLQGFDADYVRENEWNMSAGGSIGDVLTDLSQRARFFAWTDFDRAVSLSSQFQRNEIRIMAQLKLAQGILEGPNVR